MNAWRAASSFLNSASDFSMPLPAQLTEFASGRLSQPIRTILRPRIQATFPLNFIWFLLCKWTMTGAVNSILLNRFMRSDRMNRILIFYLNLYGLKIFNEWDSAPQHLDIARNSYFFITLCCSKKVFPYISIICCASIFCARRALFEALNFWKRPFFVNV